MLEDIMDFLMQSSAFKLVMRFYNWPFLVMLGCDYFDLHSFLFLEKEMATHLRILAWRTLWTEEPGGLLFMGSHRVGQDWSNLACMDAIEKKMATHSSIPAWRVPETEEPGGLLTMGLHRVGHDWCNLAAPAAAAAFLFQWPKCPGNSHYWKLSLRTETCFPSFVSRTKD